MFSSLLVGLWFESLQRVMLSEFFSSGLVLSRLAKHIKKSTVKLLGQKMVTDKQLNTLLREIYYDTEKPSSFSSAKKKLY